MDKKKKSELSELGISDLNKIYDNLPLCRLVEQEILNGEAQLGQAGVSLCQSGKYTGRSPHDKFFVWEDTNSPHIWWGKTNKGVSTETFDKIYQNVTRYLKGKNVYIFDGYCGADIDYRLSVRFLTTKAWHAHFVRNMFIVPNKAELESFVSDFLVINACEYQEKDYKSLGLNSPVFILFNLKKKIAIIGGTEYSGEMKKGIFSVMNYNLPFQNVLPMHCSANVGERGDTALFFGLSGTGKTTLSTSSTRRLIGDDEHGWSEKGVFNFEGGCYAKAINLSKEKEPEIWNTIRYGAILENVVYNKKSRKVDYNDSSITENTRISYPLSYIENTLKSGQSGHPQNLIFLTCDAFGILPPVAQLSPEQAKYHFLSGYTAKVGGTERGVTEPQATFSTCFGSPFMTRTPELYSDLLAQKMKKHNTKAYLVNTGWTGGDYGKGKRIQLVYTRTIINSILGGILDSSDYDQDPVFGYAIPRSLPGVPDLFLNPRNTWKKGLEYDVGQKKLVQMFVDNFSENFPDLSPLQSAGPHLK